VIGQGACNALQRRLETRLGHSLSEDITTSEVGCAERTLMMNSPTMMDLPPSTTKSRGPPDYKRRPPSSRLIPIPLPQSQAATVDDIRAMDQ
jgi:hypothetical protein